MEDLVISGGTVIDGTGGPARRVDVGVTGGRISAVGEGLSGNQVLDADGLVVAPGFIDIHTHYDAQVFWDPALTPSSWHGVTSVVAGNCGFSLAPCRPADRELMAHTLEHVEDMPIASLEAGIPWDFETYPEYLDAVERRGTALNYGGYVGHTSVRMYVMGADAAYSREATPDEIQAMRAVVAESMRGGALGFATSSATTHQGDGGRPVPSRFADVEETKALARVLGELGYGVGAFLPGERISHREVYELQVEVGRPFTWTALVTMPNGIHDRLLAEHEAGRALGGEVYPQVSVRPIVFQMSMAEPFTFQIVSEFSDLLGTSKEERIARYRDPTWRQRALEALDADPVVAPRWSVITVAESPTRRDLVGRSMRDLAAERGTSPLDAMIEVALDDDLETRFGVVFANDDAEFIGGLLQRDDLLLGLSDAGAHVGQLCDACFTTDLLGNWVRERGVLTLEAAVHKLTGEPAHLFGLTDRGVVRVGAAADLAVFDPLTVAPGPIRRVTDFPGGADRLVPDEPQGMVHVLVNGTPIRRDGEPDLDALESRPGQILRSGKRGG